MQPTLPHSYPTRRAAFLALACLSLLLAGCRAGPRNFENTNDELRREVITLESQIDELQEQLALRVAQIDALQQQTQARAQLADVSPADLPQLVGIRFGRYTGAIDSDGDGGDDLVRAYIETRDQEGRFLPVAGRASAQVVAIEPGQDPVVLASEQWDGEALADAYRSGMFGTHYTLELPLPQPLPEGIGQATLKVSLTDAATGVTATEQKALRFEHASPDE